MKKIKTLTLAAALTMIVTGCQAPRTSTATASDYFPIKENVHYYYEGSGNEYASYNTYIDYTSTDKVQRRTNNGGTESVSVIEVATDTVSEVFLQGETYYRDSFLNQTNKNEVLIQGPIEVGTTWDVGDGRSREITNLAVDLTTPSGDYTALEITTTASDYTTIDYYAKDIGLVKSVFTTGADEVSSTLATIESNAAFVQSVIFYYPNINTDLIYYQDNEVSFMTNESTPDALAAAYKANVPYDMGGVLTTNTTINNLDLGDDGMVHLDLSSQFLSEMNAGAGYEAMMLQCLANTFGGYYNVDKVLLTIDGGLYESGHIALGEGEYLSVNTQDNVAINY